jgi:AcrR family transcriptional regulator
MGKGAETRERIMDIAEVSVLAKGFDATSIDEIIAEAGITKSGFFYHFRDKNELARGMVRRFIDKNTSLLDVLYHRGKELSDDPLQAFLISLKLLAELLAEGQRMHPGCLIASVFYQERLFDREVVDMIRRFTVAWNASVRAHLEEIAAVYPPRPGADLDDLAESLSCIIDGAIILAKIVNDPGRIERQVLAFRGFVKLVFAPAESAVRPLRLAAAA